MRHPDQPRPTPRELAKAHDKQGMPHETTGQINVLVKKYAEQQTTDALMRLYSRAAKCDTADAVRLCIRDEIEEHLEAQGLI